MRPPAAMRALVPDVAIVTHNTDFYLLNLLRSLEPAQAAAHIADVHVWDNASTDRTSELLRAYAAARPWIRVHRAGCNEHHGPALDELLRHRCRSDWVLVLDADTELVQPFGGAFASIDASDAVFVGQIHPQMPHLYAYLAHLLVHRGRYLELPPFRHHGAPGIDFFQAIERDRRPFVRFRWCDYVHHFGQGALRRLVQRGERENPFYEFAEREQQRQPESADRRAREAALEQELEMFLAGGSDEAEPRAPSSEATASLPRFRSRSTPRWISEACLWIASPKRARWVRAARRMGLVQHAREAVALTSLLEQHRPQRVLEIGTAHGGSFLLWARVATRDATLISIDLPPWELDDPAEDDKRRALENVGSRAQSVHVIRGDSHDPDVQQQATAALAGRPLDFLFIDGDHSYEGVASDFDTYAPMVRSGGMVALHDIHPHSKGWGGEVPAFWNRIRARYRHTELVADRTQDGFGIGVIWV